jgi:hypothetical protein
MTALWLSGILGFYNIYCGADAASLAHCQSIVREQVAQIVASGLMRRVERLYVTVVKSDLNCSSLDVDFGSHAFVRCVASGGEDVSLQLLWEMSQSVRPTAVFYIHSKGSFSNHTPNNRFRRALMRYIVENWRLCYNAVSAGSADTCGMRLSPFPHVHFPGNFWWASSAYVAALVSPRSFVSSPRFGFDPADCQPWSTGRERYGNEHWITSSPSNRAFDCLPNHAFIHSYNNIPDDDSSVNCSLGPRSQWPQGVQASVYHCFGSARQSCLHSQAEFASFYPADNREGTVGEFIAACAEGG